MEEKKGSFPNQRNQRNKRWTSPCFHPSTKHTSKNYSKMRSNYYDFVTQKSQFEQEKINSEMLIQSDEDQKQQEENNYPPVRKSKISKRDRSGQNFDEEVEEFIDNNDHRNSSRKSQNKSQDEKQQEWLDEFLHGRGFDVEGLKDSQIKVCFSILLNLQFSLSFF